MRGTTAFLTALLAGCANEPSLVYAPLPPAPIVGWAFPVDDSPPLCNEASSEFFEVDAQGRETKTCLWECAYYWTQDANIGPRRYEKVFVRAADGWGSYAGDFWTNCEAGNP